jgi:gp16 family phage-associated protein
MTSRAIPLTPDQVRERFRARGTTLASWAKENGYPREDVYRVISGRYKAHYGRAHEIAVKLGLKIPDAEPSTARSNRNPQNRAAA